MTDESLQGEVAIVTGALPMSQRTCAPCSRPSRPSSRRCASTGRGASSNISSGRVELLGAARF